MTLACYNTCANVFLAKDMGWGKTLLHGKFQKENNLNKLVQISDFFYFKQHNESIIFKK